MKPLHALLSKIIIMAIGFIISQLIRKGVLSVENADALNPLILETVNTYIPIALPVFAGYAHEIYEKLIVQRLFEASRTLSAGAPQSVVSEEALGAGKQRQVAKIVLGV